MCFPLCYKVTAQIHPLRLNVSLFVVFDSGDGRPRVQSGISTAQISRVGVACLWSTIDLCYRAFHANTRGSSSSGRHTPTMCDKMVCNLWLAFIECIWRRVQVRLKHCKQSDFRAFFPPRAGNLIPAGSWRIIQVASPHSNKS